MKSTAALATASAAGLPGGQASPQKTARVVLIRDDQVWREDGTLNPGIVQTMLDTALMRLTGESGPLAAFRRFVKPDDVVGIKTNIWRMLPTPRELESAIQARLREAGVPADKIGLDDRGVLSNALFRNATVLINVRPMRTHYWSGVGGCLKNMITFTPHPEEYHDDSCADMATFWKLPLVAGKVKLNILSMFNPLFHGRGPHHFDQRYLWKYNGLLVSTDPVAVDAVGLAIMQAKRREFFGDERALQTPAKHIAMADQRHGLGTADLTRIELIRIGSTAGILI
ncbi:MAG: DUF362 domain-containing protein [Acidobacteriota bacterium]